MSNGRNAGAAASGGAIYGLGIFGAPFDYLVEHPDVLRLATWAGLERPTAVAAFEADSYRTKLITIADAQRDGRLDPSFAPADLLALALGVTGAWLTASEALRTHDSPNPWSHQQLAQFRALPSRPPPASWATASQPPTRRTDHSVLDTRPRLLLEADVSAR